MLRAATTADAAAIAEIYNHYVLHTIITFEEEAVPAAEMAQRITEVLGAGLPWFVWEEAGRVLGYAYGGKWKSRCAYRYAVESSIYLSKNATGRGLGSKLYVALIDALRAKGIHSIIGGIALPNPGSNNRRYVRTTAPSVWPPRKSQMRRARPSDVFSASIRRLTLVGRMR